MIHFIASLIQVIACYFISFQLFCMRKFNRRFIFSAALMLVAAVLYSIAFIIDMRCL